MRLQKKIGGTFTALLILFISVSAGTADAESIIATTSWTAAFALAAGAEYVAVLAPAEMLHPSEYELTPADILKLKKADLIIYAGYEVMVGALKESLGIPEEKLLQIETRHDIKTIEQSLMKIGHRLGTVSEAEKNISDITKVIIAGRESLSGAGIVKSSTWVHSFQRPLAGSLGLGFSYAFGPQPLTAVEIAGAGKQEVKLVIDNVHNPVSGPLSAAFPDVKTAVWRNFPEVLSDSALKDVISGNIERLKILYGVE
ncbi:MAG: ABC transporter substrate-binding protein [Spirochaetales bacterium]|nr:ABC transporter substrate-binding protein [Spirochaetales bacterium]